MACVDSLRVGAAALWRLSDCCLAPGQSVKPQPNSVRYNDWREVDAAPLSTFAPAMPVSVIVPCYQTPVETLARTLAALECQTYPRRLFEVVIVDDGSAPPLAPPATRLDVRMARQERCGFGLARARNTGAAAASGDILLFLDSDVLADRRWMAAHARWHHATADALTVGFTSYASAAGLSPESIRRRCGALADLFPARALDPSWLEGHMLRTNDLTSTHDDPFRAIGGGNFGIGRDFYGAVGGSDESFVDWGLEDVELAYRAYVHGGLLVPNRGAFAIHQGRWDEAGNRRGNRSQRNKAASLIAHRSLRAGLPVQNYQVPSHVVTLHVADLPPESIIGTVANLLADREPDLVVRVATEQESVSAALRSRFGEDSRLRLRSEGAALDEFPTAAFHIALPGTVRFANDLVFRLRALLGDAVAASATLDSGAEVSIARTWVLHRSRRTGRGLDELGSVRRLSANALEIADDATLTSGRSFVARWRTFGAIFLLSGWTLVRRLLAIARWQASNPRRAMWRYLWWTGRRKALGWLAWRGHGDA